MNIIIFILVILTFSYFLLKWWSNIPANKMSKSMRFLTILLLIILAILFAIGGKFLLTLPLTLLSLALVKLKGLSLIQLFSLFRLIQTLRNAKRFSFKNQNFTNSSSISLPEAYRILNLDQNKNISKHDVQKAFIKIQKKIHPDVSPETSRLSSIVNEAKDVLMSNLDK